MRPHPRRGGFGRPKKASSTQMAYSVDRPLLYKHRKTVKLKEQCNYLREDPRVPHWHHGHLDDIYISLTRGTLYLDHSDSFWQVNRVITPSGFHSAHCPSLLYGEQAVRAVPRSDLRVAPHTRRQ